MAHELPFQASGLETLPIVGAGEGGFTAPTTTPTFEELRKRLSAPTNIAPLPTLGAPGGGTQALFEKGIAGLQPTGGIRPETQRVLDLLAKRTEEARKAGASEAQALAGRRGLAGSSIEQFGTQQAIESAERAGRGAEADVLLQNVQNDVQFQQLQAQGFLDRASRIDQITSNQEIAQLQAEANRGNKQAEFALQQKLTEAGLTLDDINTQRNIDLQLQQLEVERILGERGLALTAENIRQAEDIARRSSRDQLVGNLTTAFGPALISNLFSQSQATGGLTSILSGGFGASAPPAGAASTLFPGGVGAQGAAGGAGAAGGLGSVLAPAIGLGLLSSGINRSLKDKFGKRTASIINPFADPKQTFKTITGGIKKIFGPF